MSSFKYVDVFQQLMFQTDSTRSVPHLWLSLRGLKIIGKGFVLFKINSSPTAVYTIKPICIIVIGFKVSNYFLKNCQNANPKI